MKREKKKKEKKSKNRKLIFKHVLYIDNQISLTVVLHIDKCIFLLKIDTTK